MSEYANCNFYYFLPEMYNTECCSKTITEDQYLIRFLLH